MYYEMACIVRMQRLLFTKIGYSISFPSGKRLVKSGYVMPTLGNSFSFIYDFQSPLQEAAQTNFLLLL